MLNRTLLAWAALTIALSSLLAAIVLTAPQLPDRVASHFDAAGAPDGWMSRSAYLWIMGGTAVGVTVLLLVTFCSLRYLPTSAINLPHRDYWLAPEQRDATYAAFLGAGLWLAALQAALVLGVHLLVVDANNSQPVKLSSSVWWLLGGFLLSTTVTVVFLLMRFHRPA